MRNGDNLSRVTSSRKRTNINDTVSFHKLRISSQEVMLLNRDCSKKNTFGLRRYTFKLLVYCLWQVRFEIFILLACAFYRSNPAKSLLNKRRVIKMLFVVVIEFFICWTPLYVINTIALFDPKAVYQNLGYTAISFFQLLAYSSSCCNPITYCFMNIGFRKAFLNLFRCFRHEPGRRISVSGYCMTSVGSAEAQILAATVNSLMQNESSSNNTPNDDEARDDFVFQETPSASNNLHSYENTEVNISTHFLN